MSETNNLTNYLSKLSQERYEKARRSKGKEKRITIILSEFDSRRLQYITNQFSSNQPSVFARELLIQALNDAEKFLGLTEEDEGSEYQDAETGEFVAYPTDYGMYINSIGQDDLEDDESDEARAAKEFRNSNVHGRA